MAIGRDRAEPRFLAAFSERGSAPPDAPSATAHLARRFAGELGVPELPIARADQIHGAGVIEPTMTIAPGETRCVGRADILVSRATGLGLVVQTADCVPILLLAPGAIAAVHAGWRGTAHRAAAAGVRALRERFGSEPAGIRAVLGPSIGSCCYEVGGEVASAFAGEFLRRSCGGRYYLDLRAANRSHLEAEGVPPENIAVRPECTMCGGDRFASYRRDGAEAGRMIALVARLS
jgi:YfiH family protein